MGENSNIRLLHASEIAEVSETFKDKMSEMGMLPYEKDGKVKWGNMSQIVFLQSLHAENGKKVVNKSNVNSLPPSMRRKKKKIVKLFNNIPMQYKILGLCSLLFGAAYLYINLM